MKKIILLFVACISLCAASAPISVDDARSKASGFLSAHANRQGGRNLSNLSSQLTLAYTARSGTAVADFYVFNRHSDAGYVVVAADDQVTPILGYSSSGHFDYDSLPDNARYWIMQYQRELSYLRSHPEAARKVENVGKSVEPLLTTYWNQSSPFNDLCPKYSDYSRSVAGCVAIAAAQIMNYHQWPEQGVGSKSYTFNLNGNTDNPLTLEVDFSQSTYQWNLMLDNYLGDLRGTVEQRAAVAKLVYDVAVATEMQFGSSSGTTTGKAQQALINYFGYSRAIRFGKRDAVPINDWEQQLRDELDAGRPVFYAGQASGGGHAFVFDGYDSDGYFHVNWGWGGQSNGYFIITMLNPSSQGIGSYEGGYNSAQEALFGIEPDNGQDIPTQPIQGYYSGMRFDKQVVALGEAVKRYIDGFCFIGYGELPERITFGLNIYNENDSVVNQLLSSVRGIELSTNYVVSGNMSFPTTLTDGYYRLRPVYVLDDSTQLFVPPVGKPDYYEMTVLNDTAYLNAPVQKGELELTSLTIKSERIYTNKSFVVDLKVTNMGNDEYFDKLRMDIVRNGSTVRKGNEFVADIAPGRTFSIETTVTAPSTEGDFEIILIDNMGDTLGSPVPMHVDAGGSFRLVQIQKLAPLYPQMLSDAVEGRAVLSNNWADAYKGKLEVLISREETPDEYVARLSSDDVVIAPSDTVTVMFHGAIDGAVDGERYRMVMRDASETATVEEWGDDSFFAIGLYRSAVPLKEAQHVGANQFEVEWETFPNAQAVEVQVRRPAASEPFFTESFGLGTVANQSVTTSNISNYAENKWASAKSVYSEVGAIRIGGIGTHVSTGYIYSPKLDLRSTSGTILVQFEAKTTEYDGNHELQVIDVNTQNVTSIIVVGDTMRCYGVYIDVNNKRNQQLGFRTTQDDGPVILRNVSFIDADTAAIVFSTQVVDRQYVLVSGLEPEVTYEFMARPLFTDNVWGGWSDYHVVALNGSVFGDLNGDGVLDVADVNMLINMILGVIPSDGYFSDFNDDGAVDVGDANVLLNIILGKN